MKTFRSLLISTQTIYSELTKPKLLTSVICIVALFSVDLTYGYHPISPEQMGFTRENEIAFIHSYPGNYKSVTGPFSEHSSMGSLPGGRIIQPSDSWNVYNNSDRYPGNRNSFVYFPNSGNIHHVRGVRAPALIRNVRNHNNNGRRLFWGTLNGR